VEDEMYDTIVVGGGIGGTGVAALLAQKGFKVLLVEKNKQVGGRCTSYERDGFKVPTYVHAFARANLGPCSDLAQTLGEKLEWYRGSTAMMNLMGKEIPMNIGGGGRYSLRALLALRPGWRELLRVSSMTRDLKAAYANQDLLDNMDVRTWIGQYTENRRMHSLTSFVAAATFVLPNGEGSAGEYLQIVRGMRKAGAAGYPKDECSAIPEAYLRGFKRFGGEIRHERVKRIAVQDKRVQGVELMNGDMVEARTVISNAGIKTTVLDLVEDKHFDPGYLEYVRNLKSSWSAMVVKVALEKRVTDLVGGIYAPTLDPKGYFEKLNQGELPDEMTLWVTVPSNAIPSLAPPGKQLICAGSLLPWRPDVDWSPYIKRGFETLEKLFPGIPRHTIWKDDVTPADIEKWVAREGVLIEVAQVPGQVGKDRPSIISSIDGLYFVGSDVGKRAVGVELAADSAMRCAEEVERRLGQNQEGA
jgi:phytoene dehydrogenase-like protein